MIIFLQSVGGDYHLSNSLLLCELIAKLPVSKRLKWAEKCLNLNRMPTIKDFLNWLSELRKISNMVSDSLPLEDTPSENRKYAWVVVNRKCKHCNNECRSLAICKSFLDSSTESRWQTVKNVVFLV